MGVQELIFACVNMLHMLSYVHQGVRGGGVLTFLTSTSLTLRNTLPLFTCCTCHRIFIREWGGILTFLTSTSLTLRNTLRLFTCCTCRRIFIRECWGILTFLTSTSLTLRNTLRLFTCCTCRRIFIRGWVGILTFLTSTSLTLRNTLPLFTCCTCRRIFIREWGGIVGGILTFLTSTSLTLRNTLPLFTCCTCRRIFIRGVGGYINVPDEYFTYVTEHIAVVHMLHMPSYIFIREWGGIVGCILTFLTRTSLTLRNTLPLFTCCTCRRIFMRGVGGYINFPDEYFTYVTEHVAVVHMLHMPRIFIREWGGIVGGILTFLTSTSLTLRNTLRLFTCCTCRRIFIREWGGILTFLTSTSLTLRNTLPLLTCCTCRRMFIRGVGGYINVPDEYFTYVTEHVAVVHMLHIPSSIHQGGGGVY